MSIINGQKRFYEFEQFRVDSDERVLVRNGTIVPLPPRVFDTLLLLVRNSGRALDKSTLMKELWPETFVEEVNLAQHISLLRKALGESPGEPRYIETIPRRGYRFLPKVSEIVEDQNRGLSPSVTVASNSQEPTTGPEGSRRRRLIIGAMLALGLFGSGFVVALWLVRVNPLLKRRQTSTAHYTRITNFTDSAVQPALSPDGKMLAFIRGPNTFITAGDVYTMLLPNGEPVALTRDEKLKIAPAFSTDDAHIAYTVFDTTRNAFDTWMVPALGGEPRLLFPNTTGLSWIPGQRILFSEVLSGMHMALSTSAADRSKVRHIYVPRHERGMAHFSYLSPDGKWVLLVEMDHNGDWMPCRVVPFDGNSEGRQVGPTGKCTAGAWSPDGRWIYLSVAVGGDFHIWRQRWASGQQEQITFGPTEEEGIAIAPDGRSLITSIGMRQSAIWMHDASGDREISSDGFASSPAFSSDGATLYWLRRESVAANAELWAMNLGSGTVGPALPGIAMDSYDVSADGKRVAFATSAGSGKSQIWLAPLDRLEPPKRIVSSRADTPFFSSPADLVFRLIEEKASFLEKTTVPGQTGKRIIPGTIIFLYSVSPDGLWAAARIPKDGENTNIAAVAVPLQGGPLAPIGNLAGWVTWAPDESSLYISEVSGKKSNRTLVLPISHGKALPELPPGGLRSFDEGVALPRARVIDQSSVAPSVDPSMYAYTKTSVHRNLFRIPLP